MSRDEAALQMDTALRAGEKHGCHVAVNFVHVEGHCDLSV
jgi:hypothetical protein